MNITLLPFHVTRERLKEFRRHESMPVDQRHTTMDIFTNSVIKVNFAEREDHLLGFRVVNSVQRRSGPFSKEVIVPVLKSVHPGSCAARAGLCSGMRIIAIGTSTTPHAENMPVSALDYSPARRVTELITDALQSSFIVDIRVDRRCCVLPINQRTINDQLGLFFFGCLRTMTQRS
jgi:hypothetical protein